MCLIIYHYNPWLLSAKKYQVTVVPVILKLAIGSCKNGKELNG